MRVEDLLAMSGKMFEKQAPFKSLCQTLALHFYSARADFTEVRNIGSEMMSGQIDSYPELMRRDLCDSYTAMLRDGSEWAEIYVDGADHSGDAWLEWASKTLMRHRLNKASGFTKATKQGDHDFGTFGQCVISVEPNKNYNGLLYRNWHLRDCAWVENEHGEVDHVHRKWKCEAYHLKRIFGEDAVGSKINELCRNGKDAMTDVNVRHIVMPSDLYGKPELYHFEYVSVFVDVDHQHVIQETGLHHQYYIVPRFQTIAGSPYAFSPATITALPNARALQAMTFTLMEAAERYARPPIVATTKAVRSDVNLDPDGVTWVDNEYDERFGQALRTLPQDRGGYPIGMDMRQSVVDVINACFYVDRLHLPETNHEMTAYEVQERMKQYRQRNLPLFAPMEAEYNGRLCEADFRLAFNMGLLGSREDVPPNLRGRKTEWRFKGPLSDIDEEKRVHQFNATSQLLAAAVEVDPMMSAEVDHRVAFRDAVKGTGAPANWLRTDSNVIKIREYLGQQAQQAVQAQAQIEQQSEGAAA